ncbi:MAG: hypothetical protein ABIS67_07285 [Candidatus Eisenbacteria bacterium]
MFATAAALLALVSFPLSDPDLWQHLRTGRAIWDSHALEPRNVWTWPEYGMPYVISSWLFRVLLWPFYSVGGVAGLFVWRWLTTLACFGLLWAAARASRRAGATGVAALFVLLWCGVLYRFRSQVRPETLVAVLLAAQLWLLETRRARQSRPPVARAAGAGAAAAGSPGAAARIAAGIDPAWWLVPIAVVWINVHLSYVLGLFVTAAYLLDELWRARRRAPGAAPRQLAAVLFACGAASFLNPYGFGLVRQPFDYALTERNLLAFRMIAELGPISWAPYLPTGLPLLVALPPLLALWRWRTRGPDLAQIAIFALFIPQGLATQRFIGYTVVAIAPFFARDAAEFCATRRWPAWLAQPAARAGLAAALAALLLYPAFSERPLWPSVSLRESAFPGAACDAIAAKGVRGKSFSLFSHGGFLIWRFWPARDRLPFTDIHATGTRELRDGYALSLVDSAAWTALDAKHRFDWVLLPRSGMARGPLIEQLDADTARWAAVFIDDVAAVFVRRDGASAAVAERERYRWLPAGLGRLQSVAERMGSDSLAMAGMVADLERTTRESRESASMRQMLENIARVRSGAAVR